MIRVAVVEDMEEIRQAMKSLIDGTDGFECKYTFPDGKSAISQLPSTEVDVVIMDIHLPDINGIACVKKLSELMTTTQFIMCTVYEDDENIYNALQAGAAGYLLKRTSPEKILEAITELHNGGSPMSSQIARRVVNAFKSKSSPVIAEAGELTTREKEVLDYLAKGFLYKEIADALFISKETVKKHIHNIYGKLQVQTRTAALNKVFQR